MKKIVTVTEVEGEGLVSLLGQNVTMFCGNYIYAGKLAGVNNTCALLENARIVYETGDLKAGKFRDAQYLPNAWYIQINAIESFGLMEG